MINVIFNKKREYKHGQFYVELIEILHFDEAPHGKDKGGNNCRRFGYWCDKGHLATIAYGVLQMFRPDLTLEEFYEFIYKKPAPKKRGKKLEG